MAKEVGGTKVGGKKVGGDKKVSGDKVGEESGENGYHHHASTYDT